MGIKHYDIQLSITPAAGEIHSKVNCQYVADKRIKAIELLLHRNLSITALTGNEVASFDVIKSCPFPFTPEAATIRIVLADWVDPGKKISLKISYSGFLIHVHEAWGVNCVTEKWVELGMYGPWFPWQPSISLGFTYSVSVEVPGGYQVVGLGHVENTGRVWQLTSETPQDDIVIVAAPDLHKAGASNAGVSVEVYFAGSEAENAENALIIAKEALWLLTYYRNWLQDVSTGSHASVILSPRQTGGGYARPGLVVLAGADACHKNPQGIFQYLAHEFAHLWWRGAPADSWEDWLNEGFAEYSSIKAVQARFGEETSARLVAKKRESAQALPPVRGIERTAEEAFSVLYDKASLLLFDLAAELGPKIFDTVARDFLRSDPKNTKTFLDLLVQHAGLDIAEEFDRRLGQ